MASISDRLRELGVEVGTANLLKPARKNTPACLTDTIDGVWESYPRGECFVVRKEIPLEDFHGARKLPSLPSLLREPIFTNLPTGFEIHRDQILFIDTETTGLSGGAGTYVFLIGAAKFKGNRFLLAQFFLQEPSQEPAQLEALERFLAPANLVVSYNGKSFDLPRINARFAFHRWHSPFKDIIHVDLLHTVRRLWKLHLPGCTLGELEHYLLEFSRSDLDIPGWQVAELFFNYLQSGDPTSLASIFYHNEMDVISLASLLGYITDRLLNPLTPLYSHRSDLASIAEYLLDIEHYDQAVEVFEQAFHSGSISTESRLSGMSSLANYYKSIGCYQKALPLWEQCAQSGDPGAYIELAKYHEHKSADYLEAIHWTLSVIELYKSIDSTSNYQKAIKSAEYRLARLKTKIPTR